jgi:N-acetylated-alpha-linked acidic dipeptidase
MKLADNMREQTKKENRLIREGFYKDAADPTKPFVVPEAKDDVPFFNFAPLQNAMEGLKKQASVYEQVFSKNGIKKENVTKLNQQLKDMEHALTLEQGLPGRPWYRHFVYAPGFYTGYGVKTFPGVREAIEQREWDKVQQQIDILAGVLNHYSEEIGKAANLAN